LRSIDDVIGDATPPGHVHRVLDAQLNFTSTEGPSSFCEAEQDAAWHPVMLDKIKAIEENGTWELATLPPGHHAIGLKWVYKVKRNEVGDVERYKVRLVAKGYVHHAGIDFDKVFAPVARLESVHMMLALAAHERWEVHHMDMKSAFLNGALKEEVYVQQPLGFVITGAEQRVLRLHKALYELR
jgi:hypothetical protein